MTAAEELARYGDGQGSVLTIGTFDGVHLGHRFLIKRAQEEAERRNLLSTVVTFDKIPRTVIFPDTEVPFLTDLEERLQILQSLGVDRVVPLTFDRELSQVSARDFATLLVEHLGMQHLIAGPGFALGRRREGTIEVLTLLGRELGYTLEVIEPQRAGEEMVSSTAIRNAIAAGDLEKATEYLQRPHYLAGQVIRGHNRGKAMGFPTANIDVDPARATPPDGVYVTWARLGKDRLPSVTNIGNNPTFDDTQRWVETYILDFDGDLYGQRLTIELITRLREEIKFPSIEALVQQIGKDVEQTRFILSRSHA